MNPNEDSSPAGIPERAKLEKAGTMHLVHWLVISFSILLTLFAWDMAKSQVEERVQQRFEREARHVVKLVEERMGRYEDALWAGVAMLKADGGIANREHWLDYSNSLRLGEKYPGINGIGVIERVSPAELPEYIARQQSWRPGFEVFPPHDQDEFLPITFCEPLKANAKAVGLDMAHESNRYTAAKKARATGQSQITGPIVLVQDEESTPGFLFYAPYYGGDTPQTAEERESRFDGMVYAPFIASRLMRGTLHEENRHVGLKISDGTDVLYDELSSDTADYDPEPLFSEEVEVTMNGRTWTFDIHSSLSFRTAQKSTQPMTILIGGIVIDCMMILLFVVISRANRKALGYADRFNAELAVKAEALEESNLELERFAYVASHDLQEPLRMVNSFGQLLEDEYKESFDEQGRTWLGFMIDGADRMQSLVRDLLEFSRIGHNPEDITLVEIRELLDEVLIDLAALIEEGGATITVGDLPVVKGAKGQVRLVLQNLVTNAIKFHHPGVSPKVHISSTVEGDLCTLRVEDDGIGIEEHYADRIFVIFQRLHARGTYKGTGIGLAICKKIIDLHGGKLWFESAEGEGTTFCFTLRAGRSIDPPPSIRPIRARKRKVH